LATTLLFPLAVILSDTLYRDWGTALLGMDSLLFQSLLYGLAWLVAALLPRAWVRFLPLVGSGGCVLLLVPAIFSAETGSNGLILVSAFQFMAGLAAVGGFQSFCYVGVNAERWLALLIIGLYFAVSRLIAPFAVAGIVLTRLLPVVLTVALVGCACLAARSGRPLVSPRTPDSSENRPRAYPVLVLVALYYFISLSDSWLESTFGFLLSVPYGSGMLIALVCAAVVQLVFNRSVWHLWNLYLFLAVVGLLVPLFTDRGSLSGIVGSLFNGMTDNLGYLAMLYLLGGAADREGSYGYYRVMCLFAFLFSSVVPFALERIFGLMGSAASTFALALVFACIGGYILLSPLLQRSVFAVDWTDARTQGPHAAGTVVIDPTQGLSLTAREREVFTLLLTEDAPKQIARELKISLSTFNYHSANLYRKLNVNSRVELISRYSK
jgi:DNA-binding CsgD family transcriptional regulator